MNRRALAFLLLGLLTMSCEQTTKRAPTTETPAARPKSIASSWAFLQNLSGLWLSVQYRDILYRTNSLLKAQEAAKFGTDLVFDGRSKGYALSDQWQEAECFSVRDSTMIIDCFYKPTQFRILRLTPSTLTIRTNEGDILDYTKVKAWHELSEEERTLSSFPPPASTPMEFGWLAGHYRYSFGGIQVELELLPDGHIAPNTLFDKYSLFGDPQDKVDAIDFHKTGQDKNSGWQGFVIRQVSSAGLVLDETQPQDEEGQPLIRTGRKATLMRVSKPTLAKTDSAMQVDTLR